MENLNDSLPNKNVFKLDELCRLCGCYSNRMKAIFEHNSQFNYSEIISNHFPDIKVITFRSLKADRTLAEFNFFNS